MQKKIKLKSSKFIITYFSLVLKDLLKIINSGLNDNAIILHTSGTTSKPKMVPLSHKNIINSSRNISNALKLSQRDKNMILMPSFHIHGIVALN